MPTKFSLLTVFTFFGSALLAVAAPAGGMVAEGSIKANGKDYPLTQALAYESKIDREDMIVVILSGRPVSSAQLKEAKEREKEGREPGLKDPYLKLEYSKTGEFKYWSAGAGPATIGHGVHSATGELKLQDGRASGKAMQPVEPGNDFPYSFAVRFEVALTGGGEAMPGGEVKKPGPAANVKPSVTGAFKGNGKEAKLAYVSAHWREAFGDKPSMTLVFTEKDHSKDKNPADHASFGQFGSALVISLHEDGNIFGCEVRHPALKRQTFSAVGEIKTNDFKFENGQVEGEVTTGGPLDVFGETWEVELKFVAPLGEIPPEFQPAGAKKEKKKAVAKTSTTTTPDADKSDEATTSSPAENRIKAKELAVTKDASDFEYKALVGHIAYKSKSDVKAVCAELAKGLQAQGWSTHGKDMVNPNSSILKRERGDAKLTIFVKSDGAGSEVKMMTKGLAWDEE